VRRTRDVFEIELSNNRISRITAKNNTRKLVAIAID
jgi:hypothetical protein